jgi:acetate kinase
MIMARLEHLGITLDEDKNDVLVGKSGVIHQSGAIVKVAVMPSEEMLVMLNAATVFLKE